MKIFDRQQQQRCIKCETAVWRIKREPSIKKNGCFEVKEKKVKWNL